MNGEVEGDAGGVEGGVAKGSDEGVEGGVGRPLSASYDSLN